MERPVVPQRGAYVVDVTKGKTYLWCRCGKSKKQPFCDGAHKGGIFKPLPYVAHANMRIFSAAAKRQPWRRSVTEHIVDWI